MLFKKKKKVKTDFERLLEIVFTNNNLFVDILNEIVNGSPSKGSIEEWMLKLEKDKTFTKDFLIKMNEEMFTLNYESKKYLILLLNTQKLISKCASIVFSNHPLVKNYLYNEITESVYLLLQIDKGLRQGVPLQHDTIKKAVETIHHLIGESLLNFYEVSISNRLKMK